VQIITDNFRCKGSFKICFGRIFIQKPRNLHDCNLKSRNKMTNKFISSTIIILSMFSLLFLLGSYTSGEKMEGKESSTKEGYDLPQRVQSISLNKEYDFAGEKIPLNADTKERLDRELLVNSYWQSSTLLNIKLAKKFFSEIEPILKKEGIPDDFKYLALAESGLRNVTSSAGAKGYWQFLKGAATDYGLEVNSEVDERYHLEKSTQAACKYLKKLKNQFGSWVNAAGAYNMGPTNFSAQCKSQSEDNYFDLNLGEESSRYVFRLVAMKEILKNPEAFGFYVEENQYYDAMPDFYEISVTESIPDMGTFAHKYGVSYRMLKYYNPWLIDNQLTVRNNTYTIKIPKK